MTNTASPNQSPDSKMIYSILNSFYIYSFMGESYPSEKDDLLYHINTMTNSWIEACRMYEVMVNIGYWSEIMSKSMTEVLISYDMKKINMDYKLLSSENDIEPENIPNLPEECYLP
jgi:hypothetical protein